MIFSKNWGFSLFYSIALVTGITWNIIPVSGDILTQLPYKISYLEFGILYPMFIIGAILLCTVCGISGNRINFQNLLVYSLLSLIVGCILIPIIDFLPLQAFWFLLLGMFCLGFGTGGILISLSQAVLKFSEKYKTTSLIVIFALLSIGSSFSSILVSGNNSSRLIGISYIIFFFILIGQFFLTIKYQKSINASQNSQRKLISLIIQKSWKGLPFQFWLIAFCIFLYSIMEISFWDWGTIFLYQAKNMSRSFATKSSSVYWIAATISDLSFAFIFTRFDYKKYYTFIPILIFLSYWLLILGSSKETLLLAISLAGFACAPFFPLTVRLADEKIPQVEMKAFGILLGVYFFGAGTSSYIIGLLKEVFSINFTAIYQAFSIGAIIIFILIYYSHRSVIHK